MAEPHRNPSQDEVVEAIERWFSPQWFSRFRAEPGWSAMKLFWMVTLLNWVAGHTLIGDFVVLSRRAGGVTTQHQADFTQIAADCGKSENDDAD